MAREDSLRCDALLIFHPALPIQGRKFNASHGKRVTVESKTLGVHLGPLIPLEEYDRVAVAIWKRFPESANGVSRHAVTASVGWTGLGYRARAAIEHKNVFGRLFDLEPAATQEQHYQQDNHFFGFVTNAAAAAESLVYAVHALALGIDDRELTDQLLRRQRHDMVKAIRAVDQLEGVGTLLQDSLCAADALFEMRDTLLHRGRPPRNHFVGGEYDGKMTLASNPKATPDKWANKFVFNAECCDSYALWLRGLIYDSIAHLEQTLGTLPGP